jgi:hypothetical protein
MKPSSESTRTWIRLFRFGVWFVLLTGLLPSLAVFSSTQEPWRFFFDLLTWPLDGHPGGFSDTERQLSAVLGGVLCGWAWLMLRLSKAEVFNESIRRALVQATWVWFVIDSGGSILAGIPLNAVSNLSFLGLLLWPLSKLKH